MLASYSCPADPAQSCTLSGSSLFLLNEVAGDAQFLKPVTVPDGFAAGSLDVPRAADGQLYLKLRDDPSVVNTAAVAMRAPAGGNQPSPGASAGTAGTSENAQPGATKADASSAAPNGNH